MGSKSKLPPVKLEQQADLHVGSKAQIVGLQRAIELNGLQVLVLEEEEGKGHGKRAGSSEQFKNPGLGLGLV